ncbi:MAG TPA: hypothetical protein VFY68_00560 [Nitrososphaeraceae archaeon]|nr:hypothetical protein [Nitrososphaeraceae archaeon]HEX5975730.1 hypothetical protein [Nitrososphaeraceae archaeon]
MRSSSRTRRWDVDNPNEQIRAANKELRTRLMAIVTRKNLTPLLPKGETSSSISETVDVLIHNGVIPSKGRSRESAEAIQRWVIELIEGSSLHQWNLVMELIPMQ